jgi:hypothetical protein
MLRWFPSSKLLLHASHAALPILNSSKLPPVVDVADFFSKLSIKQSEIQNFFGFKWLGESTPYGCDNRRHITSCINVRLGLWSCYGLKVLSVIFESVWYLVGLPGRGISPSQELCLHRKSRYREARTNIHALSGIQPHDLSVQAIKVFALDRAATGTDRNSSNSIQFS